MKNRKRNRMLGFNYSSNNLYFVTICVQNNLCCLGSVIHQGRDRSGPVRTEKKNHHSENQNSAYTMELNAFGLIVEERIQWLANQYKYVVIHNFVVMPNHVHIIIEIDSAKLAVQPACQLSVLKRELSLPKNNSDVKIKSLSSLMGAFKTTSCKIIHQSGFLEFSWQRSFHDHIIRNEFSYNRIFNYININPEKWIEDKFFKNH